MGEGAQRDMTRALAERGLTAAWVKPVPLITLAPGSSNHVVSPPRRMRRLSTQWHSHPDRPPYYPTTDAIQQLWEAGGWCHAGEAAAPSSMSPQPQGC